MFTGENMKKEKTKTITLKLSENTMNKMSEYFEDKKDLKPLHTPFFKLTKLILLSHCITLVKPSFKE